MLRAERALRHLKVVLVSGNAKAEERVRGFEAGADDYIVKPFSPDEFLAKVRIFLRLKSVEEVDEFQNRLLTLLGHELRTPLTEIFAPAEMLSSQDPITYSDRRQLGGIILTGATASFDSLTAQPSSPRSGADNSRWSASRRLRPADPSGHRICSRSTRSPRLQRADRGPRFPCHLRPPGHLFTIFDSILDNAIRFSRRDDSIRIRIGPDPLRPFVSFMDHGPGIDPDHVATLFDGLDVPDTDYQSSGHGLSLVIAHSLISAMGGDLSVESRAGYGSEFRVTLPLVQRSVGVLR